MILHDEVQHQAKTFPLESPERKLFRMERGDHQKVQLLKLLGKWNMAGRKRKAEVP